jgi:hypothetical protein
MASIVKADLVPHVGFEARLLEILGSAYELPSAAILDDAQELQLLGIVTEDFVVHLEHRHAWPPGMAVVCWSAPIGRAAGRHRPNALGRSLAGVSR